MDCDISVDSGNTTDQEEKEQEEEQQQQEEEDELDNGVSTLKPIFGPPQKEEMGNG